MAKRSPKPATYQDLLRVPEHLVAEIIEGELITSRRPASPHAHAASVMGIDVGGSFQGGSSGRRGPGGWWILFEPELHLRRNVLVPDLAGWRRERMPEMPNAPYFTAAPDWVCEVLSPTSGRIDRTKKMRLYARAEVAHLWLADPLLETLEIYRLASGHWCLIDSFDGNQVIRAEPFEAVELELGRWWLPAPKKPAPAPKKKRPQRAKRR
jgi:Uma2 family endonuclease